MSIIKQLNFLIEASTDNLEDVKAALKKDKQTKLLFKKDSTVADITDMKSFIETVNFHFLNNKNVLEFTKSRTLPHDPKQGKFGHYGIKFISAGELTNFRKTFSNAMMDVDRRTSEFEQLKMIVNDTFSEFTSASGNTPQASVKKEIEDWVNGNGRFFNLSNAAKTELASMKAIKPEKTLVVYRGLLFKEYDLRSQKSYDGTTNDGNGVKFLKQLRKDETVVDIDWERPSSWTTKPEIADRFAKFAAAQSQHSATLNWLQRGNKAIDGELGYVISMRVKPEDVLADIGKINVRANHGDEGEIIVKPGKYTARVVKKYNVKGEVAGDPIAKTNNIEILQDGEKFLKRFKEIDLEKALSQVKVSHMFNNPDLRENTFDVFNLSNFTDRIDVLGNPKFTKDIMDIVEEVNKAYADFNEKFKDVEFTADLIDVTNTDQQQLLKMLKTFKERAKATAKSSHFKDTGGRGLRIDLPPDMYRAAIGNPKEMKELMDRLRYSSDIRISDKELGSWFDYHWQQMGNPSASKRFDMLGLSKQQPIVEAVIKDVLKKAGVPYPDDYKEAVKTFVNVINRAYRNLSIARDLDYFRETFKQNEF